MMVLQGEDVVRGRFTTFTFHQRVFHTEGRGSPVEPHLLSLTEEVEAEKPIQVIPVSLTDFVSFDLSLVDEVETVFTGRHDNIFYLWIVVDTFDRTVREKIYEHERAIVDEFSSCEFEFNIISRRGRPLDELICDASLELTYARS